MRKGMIRWLAAVIGIVLVGAVWWHQNQGVVPAAAPVRTEVVIQGRTMGTIFQVKVITDGDTDPAELDAAINRRLVEINRSMSTYIEDSEISRFNQWADPTKKFPISEDFLQVMTVARRLHELTDGAWDGTIDPLVNLWGFGRVFKERGVPPKEQIETLLPTVGFDMIEISEEGYLVKKNPAVSLDLGSIAKGYGVDVVAREIEAAGYTDYLVEIGGEVYAAGRRADGERWRIGINKPQKTAAYNEVYKVSELENRAFATSGDYRNFFEVDGKRYSHVLDPRTGWAVANGVVSVSILADSCTFADGLATAVMVMGHEKGLELVNRLEKVEGLIVVADGDGGLRDYYSQGFAVVE
ncbi:MAG: FAD:protein FMN transferase [Thermodesulfobacteriota bacterium]